MTSANEPLAFQAAAASASKLAVQAVPSWVSLSGKLAPLAAFVVFIAPYPTVQKITKEKKVGNLPLLPYSSMVVNCFVWTVYGLLKLERKVWATNVIGCALGLFYSSSFLQHCPTHANNLPGTQSQHKLISLIILTITTFCAVMLPLPISIPIIGRMGVLFCIILYGSPLSALKGVIATKSAKSIPLPFTLACLVNSMLWSIFGTLEAKDFNIYFPNLLGAFLGLIQLFVLIIYRNKPSSNNYNMKLPI